MRILFTCLSIGAMVLLSCIAQGSNTDTLCLYFDYNKTELKEGSKHALDSVIKKYPGMNAMRISGFADYVGSKEYNNGLSLKRAQAVRHYLISQKLAAKDIVICAGMGKIERAADSTEQGYAPDRKVYLIYNRVQKDIAKLKKNDVIVMEDIHFYAGSHHFVQASLQTISDLIATLKKYPKLKIQIEGHICCETELQKKARTVYADTANNFTDGYDYDTQKLELSVNRAKEIYDKLIEGGIDAARLSYKGFGASHKLVVPELTEADKNLNRRVEIRIMAK